MNCPKCGKADFYIGFFGPDCANPSCSNFKNGKISGISALSVASPTSSKKTFKVGDRVEVHRGPDYHEGREDNFWMEGVITTIVAIQGTDENPGYHVRLILGDDEDIPPGFSWFCSGGEKIRHLS